MSTRKAAVAGRFYPGDPTALTELAEKLLTAVAPPADERLAAGYVVPHAGYRFSGPIAAQVYARLRQHAGAVRRVVLVGPSHFVPLRGCAVPTVDRWATPLGELAVASELRATLLAAATRPATEPGAGAEPEAGAEPGVTSGQGAGAGLGVVADDAPHQREHSLEVQLPFLIQALGNDVEVLPIAVGAAPAADVAAVIETALAAGGEGTVLICSTDFSHYHDHATAQRLDRRTAEAVTALRPDQIGVRDACGVFALRGTVAWARDRALTPDLLDLRTSADTQGDPERVVGYPAFALR
ncbi:MAG: AmmeMemoRadiSam system protein B [Micromonosporaceae bacterium]